MRVVLDVIEGPDKGRRFVYEGFQSFVLGRSGQEDSRNETPSDPSMSRHHMMLVFGGASCTVLDLSSSNGVFVNGAKVDESELQDGDVLGAGRTKMRLRIDDSRQAAQPEAPRRTEWLLEEFELLERIGTGSMGVVHRARSRTSGEPVAIKIIRIDPRDSDDAVNHFLREVQISGRLDHPNIVRTFNAGRERERLWLAMEHVAGHSLRDRVDIKGPLPEDDVRRLGADLLDAVAYAHGLGIVHRDIKPANVLLVEDADGLRPKLADFGLAKCTRTPGAPCLTTTGGLKGTPRYMPREQVVDARNAGPAADIFSVGATLYFALTNMWHFDSSEQNAWGAILSDQPIPVRERRSDVDPSLARVIDQALAVEPNDRHASAAAMLHAWQAH